VARGGALIHLPKINFPAVVCNTEVTAMSTVLPIILRALSTTTMVPCPDKPHLVVSFPSFRMNTRIARRAADRLQRIRQFVDVQHCYALQLRDFVQVEIVGDDLAS